VLTVSCWKGKTLEIDPARTALIAIDMQRDFIDPQGMCAQTGDDPALLRAIVPVVARLSDWARNKGIRVIHTREGYAPDRTDMHDEKRARRPDPDHGPLGRFLIRGEAGHDFVAALMPHRDEWVIDKPGFGAFYRTDLEERLHNAGIATLILCGVTTSCCVQSTAREATDRGFRCLTVADASAALELDDHDRALDLIASESNIFGEISDTTDLGCGPPSRSIQGIMLRTMTAADGPRVLDIYAAGIATGHATFQTEPGSWDAFDAGKLPAPRIVATDEESGAILGFAALSPTSARPIYRGICEVTIYIDPNARGRGVGHLLMDKIVEASEDLGIWTLTAGIFPENKASLILHRAHGFRSLGRQRGPGLMPSLGADGGPMAGQWRDVIRLERRSRSAGT